VTGHLPAARGRRETGARTGAPHSRPGEERAVEDHVKQSGMTYTILAPSVFMEIWLSPALRITQARG